MKGLLHRAVQAGALGGGAALTAGYLRRRARRARWEPPTGRAVPTRSLSCRVLGDSGSPILLLHGLVASGIFWGGAYDHLAERHRLVVPDLLGFGRSPRPASGYSPDDHARAVVACLDDLGITEPAVIGAHSLGVLIAMRLAATHPDRVSAIVGFGPPIYADPVAARSHVAATSAMGRLFVLPGPIAETACRWVCDHRDFAARIAALTHPGLPPEIAADAVQHTWASYSQTLRLVILAAEATTWLDDITCPVRLVAGDEDAVTDLAYLQHLADAHDNVELHVWPGSHDLPLVKAGDCAAMIAEADLA